MKQYIGISRDHSGSMFALKQAAMKDYNDSIAAIKAASSSNNIDTIVSVVKCGVGSGVVAQEVTNSNVQVLQPLRFYNAEGQTPLFDSVGMLIDMLRSAPDINDPNVSFLIMAITDGEENYSRYWSSAKLADQIKILQSTDRWTFVFRVPNGYKKQLVDLGIPGGNIQEWDTTERGLREGSVQTQDAFKNYYAARSTGVRSTDSFYANLGSVSQSQMQAVMTDISITVKIWPVRTGGSMIRPFVEKQLGHGMTLGAAFYQLNKPEKAVQSYKQIIIRDKQTGSVYAGVAARELLGLPTAGTIKLAPGDHGNYEIYIQSTSVNRKLIAGTNVLYWDQAIRQGVAV